MESVSDLFFPNNFKQKHVLEQRLRVEDRGCLQNDRLPPTGGTVPYPNEQGHEGCCQRLELNVRKAIGVFWHN